MTSRSVVVHRDVASLVAATAARLIAEVTAALAARPEAHVVLTGGRVGTAVLAAVRDAGAGVPWARVHVWWGDERFVPAGHDDRNETQARAVLLDHVALDPAHVHPMPSVTDAPDVDVAAQHYAAELAAHAGPGRTVPPFDVLLLGVGDDGHVASLFPGLAGVYVADRATTGVRGSPKPPPERVSLTLPAIGAAREVWLVVAGADKAGAVAQALAGAEASRIPAAGARGVVGTRWLLDADAAADVSPDVVSDK